MTPDAFEEQQEALDPHRREERDGARMELSSRLHQKGVLLDGSETAAQLDDLLTGVDRFEAAVIARGGDLMINTPFSSEPENPQFVLPRREPGEDVDVYAGRIVAAASRLEKADL
ncbi:MAG TPA: hypothetical protein VFS56_05750 [Gemmatimonadaceae bacterium]|nr:hypothetical protein [Gemmatimonadaceae bacterium]